jgi:hypothetical protein
VPETHGHSICQERQRVVLLQHRRYHLDGQLVGDGADLGEPRSIAVAVDLHRPAVALDEGGTAVPAAVVPRDASAEGRDVSVSGQTTEVSETTVRLDAKRERKPQERVDQIIEALAIGERDREPVVDVGHGCVLAW